MREWEFGILRSEIPPLDDLFFQFSGIFQEKLLHFLSAGLTFLSHPAYNILNLLKLLLRQFTSSVVITLL